jgi:hypothetical protein
MLSSITPLGERGRNNRFAVTATFFVAGSIAGGVALGAGAGSVGRLLVPDRPTVIVTVLAVGALVGALLDARVGGLRLPTIRRQVDDRWLHRYRGWVYGGGFGVQLGAALTTIVSSAAVYLMVLAALGSRSLVWGGAIGAVFGSLRGASLLLAARVQSIDELRRFHRALASNARRSERFGIVSQGLIGMLAIVAVAGVR